MTGEGWGRLGPLDYTWDLHAPGCARRRSADGKACPGAVVFTGRVPLGRNFLGRYQVFACARHGRDLHDPALRQLTAGDRALLAARTHTAAEGHEGMPQAFFVPEGAAEAPTQGRQVK